MGDRFSAWQEKNLQHLATLTAEENRREAWYAAFKCAMDLQRGAEKAATEWIKFEPDNIMNLSTPRTGEWCLWSFVTEHGREYYSGSWYEHEGKKLVRTEYGWSAELKDAYFARVNKLPVNGHSENR